MPARWALLFRFEPKPGENRWLVLYQPSVTSAQLGAVSLRASPRCLRTSGVVPDGDTSRCVVDRMACVDVPAFPLQLLIRRYPEWTALPAAVVEYDRPQGVILWVNEPARRAGATRL